MKQRLLQHHFILCSYSCINFFKELLFPLYRASLLIIPLFRAGNGNPAEKETGAGEGTVYRLHRCL